MALKRDDVDPVQDLMESTNVPELRRFCKEHGVRRPRGSSKEETARAAADQAHQAVLEFLGVEEPEPRYRVLCPCGHDEWVGTELEPAVAEAEEHARSCRDTGGEGLGGLHVYSEGDGCRVWTPDEGYFAGFRP